MKIREILALAPVVPVLTITELDIAVPLAQALVRGGLPVLEVTLRTPCALAAIDAMRRAVPEAIVGAGTLTRPADFAAVSAAGAMFGVTPGLTAPLIEASRNARFPLLPGIMTPTELIQAVGAGFETLKFFPAEPAGGVAMLQAFAAPFPQVLFCPTGGITLSSAPRYLAQGNVACVGGSWVTPQTAVQARDWDQITELAAGAARLKARAG